MIDGEGPSEEALDLATIKVISSQLIQPEARKPKRWQPHRPPRMRMAGPEQRLRNGGETIITRRMMRAGVWLGGIFLWGMAALPLAAQIPSTARYYENLNQAAFYDGRGVAKAAQGDNAGAITDFDKAIEVNSMFISAYCNRAVSKCTLGDIDGALADCNQAIKLDSSAPNAFGARASCKIAQGDWSGALADLNQALQLKPFYPASLYALRGNVRFQLGDLRGALADCNQAIQCDSKTGDAYVYRARVRLQQGDPASATADFDKAIELNPKSSLFHDERGNLEKMQGNTAGALADYEQALQLNPDNAVAYTDRAFLEESQKDLAGASADIDHALQINPRLGKAYSARARIEEQQKDPEGAARDFETAVGLGVHDSEAYFHRGASRQARGDLPGALANYSEAIGIDPKAYLAYLDRGTVEQAMGDWDKAIADYSQVIAGVPVNADTASFYLWIAQRHQNSDGTEADAELSKYLAARPAASQQDWHAQIGGFLLGHIGEAAFLTAAAVPDPKVDAVRHCEAWYYAGMKRLSASDEAGADDCFRKCLATEVKSHREYFLASTILKTATPEATETPTPPASVQETAPQP